MKVALVHDYLVQNGGAEKVLEMLASMFGEAPIYTLLYDKENFKEQYANRKIEVSIIQKLPWGLKHYRWYLPFMPMAVEFFDLSKYDLIISDSSAFSKGVITSPDSLHICYCHTPTRYLWSDTHQYISELKYNKYFKKIIAFVLNYIRMWDKLAADRVDIFLANSKTVQQRIKKYYRRDSQIVYPSIEDKNFYISKEVGDYFLAGCRLVPYKRIDVIIKAFKQMSDKKLKIFGSGMDMDRLKKIAGDADNIEFLGRVSQKEKFELFSKAKAFINPQKEDFGLTIVESMASGRPVIALGEGGALETVIDGKTGILFKNGKYQNLIEAVEKFGKYSFNPEEIRQHAMNFSEENFKNNIHRIIKEEYFKFKDL